MLRHMQRGEGITTAAFSYITITALGLFACCISLWNKHRDSYYHAFLIYGAIAALVVGAIVVIAMLCAYQKALDYLDNCLDNLRKKKASIETGKADDLVHMKETEIVKWHFIGLYPLVLGATGYCISYSKNKYIEILSLSLMIVGIFVTFMPLIIRAIGIVYQKIDNSLNNSNEKKASIGTDRVDVGRNEKRSSDQSTKDKKSQNSTDKENISTDHINEKQLDSRGSKDTQNVSSHENERSQNSTDKEDTSTDQVSEELLSSETTGVLSHFIR